MLRIFSFALYRLFAAAAERDWHYLRSKGLYETCRARALVKLP